MKRMVLLVSAAAFALLASSAVAEDESERLVRYTPQPTDAAIRAALPKGAPSTAVTLSCLAERDHFVDCKVTGQDPPGRDDVGLAAAKFAEAQKYAPLDRMGKPVAGRRFEVKWDLLGPGDSNPDWLRKPSEDTLSSALPARAIEAKKDGAAVIRCQITIEGFLDRCRVLDETPEGYGFGAAALHLATHFAMKPKIRGGKPVPGGEVTIPINWKGWAGSGITLSKTRIMFDPNWIRTPSAAAVKAAYPAKASSLTDGQATIRCQLDTQANTRKCKVLSESPGGRGFGAAALSLGDGFTVQLPPEEAKRTANLSVDIPFRLRNPAQPDDASLTQPRWTQTLSEAGADLLFPKAARSAGLATGLGSLNCAADATGALVDCRVVREEPAGQGFGAAALEASKFLKMNPWTKTGDAVEGRRLTVPIRFSITPPTDAAQTPPKP